LFLVLTGCGKNEDSNVTCDINKTGAKTLNSDSLAQKVLSLGIKPIPADEQELKKLIENSKNPITEAKVELGKNFILIQGCQKVI